MLIQKKENNMTFEEFRFVQYSSFIEKYFQQ